jgi:hypothetical protein
VGRGACEGCEGKGSNLLWCIEGLKTPVPPVNYCSVLLSY